MICKTKRKKRKYFYIAIVIMSFLLTAGEIVATALLALPLFCLYETGLIMSRFWGKKEEVPEKNLDPSI